MLKLQRPLTMYVARHSWASAAKAKNVPLSVISEGMGHDSEATTQIYLASVNKDLFSKILNLFLRDGYLSTKILIFDQNTHYLIRKHAFGISFLYFV